MHPYAARREAKRDSKQLSEVEHPHTRFLPEHFLGSHLVHLEPRVAGGTLGSDHVCARRLRRAQNVENELGRGVAVGQRVRAAAASGLQRKINILCAGGLEEIIHEVRLRGRLAAGTLVLLGEDVARARVHAAVVVGNL